MDEWGPCDLPPANQAVERAGAHGRFSLRGFSVADRSNALGVSRGLVMSLSLPLGPCWELEERRVDSAIFLRSLASMFHEASAAFFEGSSIASDIVAIFERHVDPGPYLPQPQTLWSVTISGDSMSSDSILRFRCLFTPALCEALAVASLNHAEPELFDHMFLYAGCQPLLEWPDAFSNCMWIAPSIPEEQVAVFAARLGLRYKYVRSG